MANTSASAAPLQLTPSWTFNGDLGNFSSFDISIGTPAQSFRVWPSTAGTETWVVLSEGCEGILSGVQDCGSLRGVSNDSSRGFEYDASSTWELIGIYSLAAERNLFGTSDTGLYGLDTVTLQSANGTTLAIDRQTVAGISTQDYWLGILGLGTSTANFSTQTNDIPSLLDALKTKDHIPSLSFGYAAGASYLSSPDYGSLILGGFDKSRFEPTNLTMPMGGGTNQTLAVSVKSIIETSDLGASALLTEAIVATVDSTVPELWLPQAACDLFAAALGLALDDATGLYLRNTSQNSDVTITFTVAANSTRASATQNIELPLAAFEMTAGVPLYNSSTPVFPLRVSANANQITLGRAFLQEAYLVVDWERQNFTLAQVIHSNSSANIVAISPQPNGILVTDATRGRSNLTSGAIAGIAVGLVVAVLGIVAIAFCMVRKKRRSQRLSDPATQAFVDEKRQDHLPELPSGHDQPSEGVDTQIYEANGDMGYDRQPKELMSDPVSELPGTVGAEELDSTIKMTVPEKDDGKEAKREVHELP